MIGEILVTAFLVVGGLFAAIGSYGLLKLDNPMSRLHAPTKISTLGVGGLLAASIIRSFMEGNGSLHETLVMGFLFVTAPISAHFIAKVHIHRLARREELPPTATRADWAVFDRSEPAREHGPRRHTGPDA